MIVKSLNRAPGSNLTHLGYDAEEKLLAVAFKGKDIYTYANVSPEQYEDLAKSGDEIGTRFQSIKKNSSVHKFTKITDAARSDEDFVIDTKKLV